MWWPQGKCKLPAFKPITFQMLPHLLSPWGERKILASCGDVLSLVRMEKYGWCWKTCFIKSTARFAQLRISGLDWMQEQRSSDETADATEGRQLQTALYRGQCQMMLVTPAVSRPGELLTGSPLRGTTPVCPGELVHPEAAALHDDDRGSVSSLSAASEPLNSASVLYSLFWSTARTLYRFWRYPVTEQFVNYKQVGELWFL